MQALNPGTVVAIDVGLIEHVGIVTNHIVAGQPTVISNSFKTGGVAEEPLQSFANGHQVRVIGYLGKLSPSEVVQRARSQIGKAWDLFQWNCEHFVHWAHGLKPKSQQLIKWGVVCVLVGSVIWIATRR